MRNFPGLDEIQRRKIADGLRHVLADTFTLYLKTHAFHWNVEGARFYGLHGLFEAQYHEMWSAIDGIAERIRALGEVAPGTYGQLASLATVREQPGVPAANAMISELLVGHETVIATIRTVLASAQDARDEATAGILATRLEAHEKAAWMLTSLEA
jgi:starvation-inducible DNA-binding protein